VVPKYAPKELFEMHKTCQSKKKKLFSIKKVLKNKENTIINKKETL
jgi:hypothetical protein